MDAYGCGNLLWYDIHTAADRNHSACGLLEHVQVIVPREIKTDALWRVRLFGLYALSCYVRSMSLLAFQGANSFFDNRNTCLGVGFLLLL